MVVKAGVIGTGFIGPIHVEAIRRTNLGEVVAIAGSNIETAKEKAKHLRIEKAYGDYRDLLKDDEVEVVHICTPNNLHYQMAKEALLAGKHVVCEKPLTMTREEAEDLLELVNKTGLVNAVNFNVRYYPMVRESRIKVESGDVGIINAIQGSYLQDWLFFDTDYSWRLEPELSGESKAVADIGTHWLDLIEYISKKIIVEVMADFATFHKTRKKPLKPVETWSSKLIESSDYEEVQVKTEDYASVLLHFEDGGHGVFTVNQVAAGRKNRVQFEINGSKSSLVWESERPNELLIGYREKANEMLLRDPALVSDDTRSIVSYPGGHNEGFPDTTKQLFKEVYQEILSGERQGLEPNSRFPSFYHGYREVLLCDAIIESAKTRKWVEVK
ncbi:Gfo/Idh/MocA family oxidoreductase [Bacillus sp. FJAT-50079]|uniref:Gfo/Idh/MocA family protein n=1 Tax=Bacillus sp. FJAT-50079 TaxID=2833577 RepID=UPI0020162217|nr:Gfo/Idh/MocA family oxidoreductase [Bacillus sp. FJAT-50079]